MHALDYFVLAGYLALMLAVGAWFSRTQRDSQEFFLAGRAMGWLPLGLSVMATLLSALTYTGVPGEAYAVGFRYALLAVLIWLLAPLMWVVILPLYRGLRMYSVYEYLELRYDRCTRLASTATFILWRLPWLGGVLYAPAKVVIVAAALEIPEWTLLTTLGLVATAYTFLGGMKAVIWTDVVQTIVMASCARIDDPEGPSPNRLHSGLSRLRRLPNPDSGACDSVSTSRTESAPGDRSGIPMSPRC